MKEVLLPWRSSLTCIWFAVLTMLCSLLTFDASGSENPSFKQITDSLEIERLKAKYELHLKARSLDSARIYLDSVHDIARKSGMRIKTAEYYFNYSLIERAEGNMDAYIENLEKSIPIFSRENAWKRASMAHTGIGQELARQQKYKQALDHFTKSLGYRELDSDSLGMANNLINLGGLSYYTGNLADASEYFYRALRIADDLENPNLKAIILMNLSNVHLKQKNHIKAIEYLERALVYRRATGNRRGESDVLLNLGNNYYELGEIDKAVEYYTQTLKIKEELGDDLPGIMKVYNNLGVIARDRGDDSKAIEYYKSTLEIARQVNDKFGVALALNNLGSRMMANNDPASLPILLESLEITREIGHKKQKLSTYDNLQQYYSKFGDFEQAYFYALHYQALYDSIYNEESAAKIIELQTQYDTEMKEKENQILRERERTQMLRNRILALFVAVFAILALSLYILLRLKRKSLKQSKQLFEKEIELRNLEREKSEKENQHLQEVVFAEEQINKLQRRQLDEKNRELTTSTLHIINKNEVLSNIRQLADKILNGDGCDKEDCIKKLIREVDGNFNLDEQWELFKRHFESVHTGYFARLSERYPGITQNELKLCAYLRMNLSTKEISQMLNISIDSVATKRYRLRKKLLLENDNNLVGFLSDL
jgi:tetratricopeptide (TPR) repeat protein/DNA-binding CsgD family transcriptional regulator